MSYVPSPVDTAGVHLPADLIALTEHLAKNTHESWAKLRLDQGWRYGEKRDDAQKRHPCLIPYEQLPDSEKEFDRKTALEAIRLILSLGYKIEGPGE